MLSISIYTNFQIIVTIIITSTFTISTTYSHKQKWHLDHRKTRLPLGIWCCMQKMEATLHACCHKSILIHSVKCAYTNKTLNIALMTHFFRGSNTYKNLGDYCLVGKASNKAIHQRLHFINFRIGLVCLLTAKIQDVPRHS